MSRSCLIIGGGIAGLAAALSLSQIGISCVVYELRSSPSNIGGAINLTPNALRLLDYLDVEVHGCRVDSIEVFSLHTGARLGELPFRKFGPASRVLREDILSALLHAAENKGIPVIYGSKLVAIKDDENGSKVTALFEGGEAVEADLILGCDGVHSAVRTQCVDPPRLSTYTGVAAAYSIIDGRGIDVHFRQTALNSGRFGSLVASYIDPDQTKVYIAAVMESPEKNDKQGWRARGSDRQKTLDEVERRYKGSGIPCVVELVKRAEDFILYPVYRLGPGGVWSRGRVVLLGDAAHAMPPQGESTGLAIEDGVLLARVLSIPDISNERAFEVYEKTRRPRIDNAYREAVTQWENVKNRSWLMQKAVEWLIWAFLWYKRDAFEARVSFDIRTQEIIC